MLDEVLKTCEKLSADVKANKNNKKIKDLVTSSYEFL